jgi:hypothetical protein
LLFALEEERGRTLAAVYAAAAQGQWPQALVLAGRVDALRRDEESQRLLALGSLFQRDFARALQRYWEVHRQRQKGE